ncbi:shieldin complex subunit 3 [Siniperca chuatsi]|uniref:shieldin complex subunit 3 n=1 Tax=Siniperca chuatsi TaxID=119488 RepID=UPI001CE1BB00|nr:shieldin complex subunit 3 [Siniperca chuatsi]XP_044053460.1 shieldin complex subunit 3 [Siniperca chuatsi]XP_044053461.1 shieldin complex subunit 3 [Siniperca chuatsi]XP_044053462.1 shieldin complex subunit 3 [Siniperca chuatsi]
MEDVVLHYQPGSAAGLGPLLERTERLLESFPCRTPPAFSPWFPSAADRHLPIRPAKPAPVITSSADLLVSDSRARAHTAHNKPETDGLVAERPQDGPRAGTTRTPPESPQKPRDGVCVSETPNHLLPASLFSTPEREITRLSPEKHKDGFPVTDSAVKRSWSVFTQKGVLLQSSQSLSKQFHHMVSIHRLHLRQRAKWVVSQHNWGAARDIEQVWSALSRSVRRRRLSTCNANIQRERAEIWVFCDLLCSEQVGRALKDELQLSGRISLSVHRLGNIFSM